MWHRVAQDRLSTIDQAPDVLARQRLVLAMRAAVRHATIAAVVVGFTAVVAAATDGLEVTARIVGIAIVAYSLGWWVWLLFLRGLLVRHGTAVKRTSRAGLLQIALGGVVLLAGAALGSVGFGAALVIAASLTPGLAAWWATRPATA